MKVISFIKKCLHLHRITHFKTRMNMKSCSQSVANYLLDLSDNDGYDLSLLSLMKLTYLVQGFNLAFNQKSALNPHYDRVEAWKYGPVIPSLYHEFKRFGNRPIKDYRSTILVVNKDEEVELKDAVLESKQIKQTSDFVWASFKDYTPFQLVEMTHAPGSPWASVYQEGENNIIKDSITQKYFSVLVKVVKEEIDG